MNIELNDLYEKGKALVIKGNEYFPSKAYIEPFVERMSKFTNNFTCQVKLPDTMTKNEEDELNEGFTRVWVQAVLPDEYAFEGHQQSVSILYALDTRKPIVKLFKNSVNMACLNMCVFNPEFLWVDKLEPQKAINFKFVTNVMEMTDKTTEMLRRYDSTRLKKENVLETLGTWVDRCIKTTYDNGYNKVKLAESLPIEVYKDVFIDKDSPYFCEDDPTYFNIYNAFTYRISNDKGKDIVNKFEKTYLVSEIIGI